MIRCSTNAHRQIPASVLRYYISRCTFLQGNPRTSPGNALHFSLAEARVSALSMPNYATAQKGAVMHRKQKIFTIPNLLSFFRLLLIPLMWELYVIRNAPGWTVAVLALSALTDIADGKIARKYNMTSDLGKILDPIADKLTQLTLIVCLIRLHYQLIYILALQVLKEMIMAIAGLLVIKRTKQVRSAILPGKICTVVLDSSLLLLFLFPQISQTVVWLLTLLCCTAIIISLILYLLYYRTLLRQAQVTPRITTHEAQQDA